jgi:hypothetical protein
MQFSRRTPLGRLALALDLSLVLVFVIRIRLDNCAVIRAFALWLSGCAGGVFILLIVAGGS